MAAPVVFLSVVGPAPPAMCAEGQPTSAEPRLPRALLIGDSISRGYTKPVRARLKGTAEVHGLPIAVSPTTRALAEIDGHLSKMRWDVIHFNWGLNDLEHSGAGRPRISLELYDKNLCQLLTRLEKTGAVLIWASTTPVPEGTRSRTAGDAVKYNAVAADVMKDRNVLFNDLYAFALPRLATIQDKANVHFNEAGSVLLAGEVARSVRIALAQVPRRSKNDPPPASDPRRIDIGLQKQLLVDDYVIAERKNVTRELGKVKKVGVVAKPSLETDFHPSWKKPDGSRVALDFGYYLTVLRNEKDEKFQMWYMGHRNVGVGYAESKDGIHWTKPLVGKDGKDNIVHRCQGFSCTIDPSLPWGHPEKYKGAGDFGRSNARVAICHSPDGIHWSDYNRGQPVSHRAADTHNQLLWDPIAKGYRLLTRTDLGGGGGVSESRSTRIMIHTQGNNLKEHPTAWKTVIDRIAVDDPEREKNRWGKPRLQFNGMTMWIYEGVYFGLMDVYTMGKSEFFDGFDYETRHDDDYMNFYIGTSRDGANFDKSWIYARKPLVPRGKAGSFDKDGIKPPAQIVTYKDEHWIFYGGMDERHYSRGRHLRIGLAKLRLDGFICLAAKSKTGTVVTKPFKLEGDKLAVNVDAKDGWVRVELLDETGRAIPGFSGDAAKKHKNVDELRLAPQWESGGDLSRLKGKIARLRLTFRNAKLYAFDFD